MAIIYDILGQLYILYIYLLYSIWHYIWDNYTTPFSMATGTIYCHHLSSNMAYGKPVLNQTNRRPHALWFVGAGWAARNFIQMDGFREMRSWCYLTCYLTQNLVIPCTVQYHHAWNLAWEVFGAFRVLYFAVKKQLVTTLRPCLPCFFFLLISTTVVCFP